MIVYIALAENSEQNNRILGLYSSEDKAVERCLKEPSYSTFKWQEVKSEKNYWHNSLGLFVKVKNYLVE